MGLQCQVIIRCHSPQPPPRSRGGEPVSTDHANLVLIRLLRLVPSRSTGRMSRSDHFPNLIFSLMQLWYLSSVRVGCQFFYSRNGNRLHVGETLDPDHVESFSH